MNITLIEQAPGTAPSKEFIESVKLHGVIEPLVVRAINGGKFEVVDGRRRLAAAQAAGLKDIPAVEMSEHEQPPVIAITLNAARRPNEVSEYLAIQELLGQGLNENDIHKQTGMAVGTIRERLRLANLNVSLFEALATGLISYSVAKAALKLESDAQTALADKLAMTGELKLLDVAEARRAAQENGIEEFDTESVVVPWMKSVASALKMTLGLIPTDKSTAIAAVKDAILAVEGYQA